MTGSFDARSARIRQAYDDRQRDGRAASAAGASGEAACPFLRTHAVHLWRHAASQRRNEGEASR